MRRQRIVEDDTRRMGGDDARQPLLSGAPVTQRRLELAGVSTAVLEGGDGPPVVLLHGQGSWAGIECGQPGSVPARPGRDAGHDPVRRPTKPAHPAGLLPAGGVDPARVRALMGERWKAFQAYGLDHARTLSVRAANRRLLRELGTTNPSVIRAAQPIVASGGRSLSLQALARAGATLVGRPVAVAGERVSFDGSVQANIAAGDAFAAPGADHGR